jgi:hypothetical protein
VGDPTVEFTVRGPELDLEDPTVKFKLRRRELIGEPVAEGPYPYSYLGS